MGRHTLSSPTADLMAKARKTFGAGTGRPRIAGARLRLPVRVL